MRRELKRGDQIQKASSGRVLEAKDADRTIVHVITSRIVDREGDVVEPSGGRFENYRKNPVVLFGHRSYGLPVARNLELDVRSNEIVALTQFAGLNQAADDAEQIYRLVRDGFLPATSIGFMPITWSEDKALPAQDGWWFKEWELFEYSVVAIPANPDALMRMIKAYGLPEGASEKDLGQAIHKTRAPYWDVAASFGKAAPTAAPPAAVVPRKTTKQPGQLDPAEPLVAMVGEIVGELGLIGPLVQGGTLEELRTALGLVTEIDDEIDEATDWLLQAIESVEESSGTRSMSSALAAKRRGAAPLMRARSRIATVVADLARSAVEDGRPELLVVAGRLADFVKEFEGALPPEEKPIPVKDVVAAALQELAGAGTDR